MPVEITITIAIVLITSLKIVKTELMVKPKETEIVVGSSTFFNCSTTIPSTEIQWFHYPIGSQERSLVFGFDKFYGPYLGRFQLEKNDHTDAYNLVIPSVKIEDSGRYECQDDVGRGAKSHAELIVLEEAPVCLSDIRLQGLIGPNNCGLQPDTAQLSCVVQYRGNEPPVMELRTEKNQAASPLTGTIVRNATDNRIIYSVMIKGDSSLDGSAFRCLTTRSASVQYGCSPLLINVVGYTNPPVAIICLVILLVIAVSSFLVYILYFRKRYASRGQKPIQPEEQIPLTKPKQAEETGELSDIEYKCRANRASQFERVLYQKEKTKYAEKPKLVHEIAADKEATQITGMALLEGKLFVAREKCKELNVYDSTTFNYERNFEVSALVNPLDIAATELDKHLYILNQDEAETSTIMKLSMNENKIKGWKTESDLGRISTYDSHIIVCLCNKRMIIEYSLDGDEIRRVLLSPSDGFDHLHDAIKVGRTHYAVIHFNKNTKLHRMCVIEVNEGTSNVTVQVAAEEKLNKPLCLIEDNDKSLIVADMSQGILLFNYRMNYIRKFIPSKKIPLIDVALEGVPIRLCLNKGRLFVTTCKEKDFKHCRILIFNLL